MFLQGFYNDANTILRDTGKLNLMQPMRHDIFSKKKLL